MNIRLFTTLLIMLSVKPVYALLPADANLTIDAGSSFGLEIDFWSDTPIVGHNGINLGTIQLATGAHSGFPDGSENPDIDEPWDLLAQTGMHQSNTPVNVLSDDGAGNVLLDFSGWGMTIWTDPNIDLGSGVDAGIASMTCSSDCSHGDSYILSYHATVPVDEPSIFMGFDYRLNLVGTISDQAEPAGPLPVNTLLTIEPGIPGDFLCAGVIGSCFYLDAPFDYSQHIEPGTDGGIVIGKSQASGGQEFGPSGQNSTPGEITAAWFFYDGYATITILPGDANSNIFHSESCTGIECVGKTEINEFYIAWNGDLINLSAGTVNNWIITPDDSGGASYYLDYSATVTDGIFAGFGYNFEFRGDVVLPPAADMPVVNDVNFSAMTGRTTTWMPDFSDDPGNTHICKITTPATNGFVAVSPDCSIGTYYSGSSTGTDSFSYTVTNQKGLSATANGIVDVIVSTPNYICSDQYPQSIYTTIGGGQNATVNATLTTTFIGHIISGSRINAVNICPEVPVYFEATSTEGDPSCKINNAATASSGHLYVGDKLICTNKPDGSDTDRFSIRNGY